jgi:hypothetical protein
MKWAVIVLGGVVASAATGWYAYEAGLRAGEIRGARLSLECADYPATIAVCLKRRYLYAQGVDSATARQLAPMPHADVASP